MTQLEYSRGPLPRKTIHSMALSRIWSRQGGAAATKWECAMPSQAGFASIMPSRDHPTFQTHSTHVRRLHRTLRSTRKPGRCEIFLTMGLLLAIAAGLIGLRAAIWLPPVAM